MTLQQTQEVILRLLLIGKHYLRQTVNTGEKCSFIIFVLSFLLPRSPHFLRQGQSSMFSVPSHFFLEL